MMGKDKLLHYLFGSIIAAVLLPFIGGVFALMVVAAVGIGKEVYDHFFGGTVEAMDVVWTVFGGVVVVLPTLL